LSLIEKLSAKTLQSNWLQHIIIKKNINLNKFYYKDKFYYIINYNLYFLKVIKFFITFIS